MTQEYTIKNHTCLLLFEFLSECGFRFAESVGETCNMFAICIHVVPFWGFWFVRLRDIHKINDGSPVISRNT
jgi:hypothetical protein